MLQARQQNRRIQLLAFAALALAAALATTACGEQAKNNQGGDIAVTALSAPSQACAAGMTYQGNAWNRSPHAQLNVVPYGSGVPYYDSNLYPSQQAYCGCAAGTQAMCDSQYGLVCVPSQILGSRNIAWWTPQNGSFSHIGYTAYGNVYDPRTNMPPPPARQIQTRRGRHGFPPAVAAPAQCSNQIGITCQVGIDSCGYGSYCRPLAPNHALGVCAR